MRNTVLAEKGIAALLNWVFVPAPAPSTPSVALYLTESHQEVAFSTKRF